MNKMTKISQDNKKIFTNDEEINDNYVVSSLVRGLQILSTFTVARPSLKVSEIAEINNLDQATVFRFVYTLEKLGYLIRDEETKRYRQGLRMLTISLPAREGIIVRQVALPIILELAKIVNETVRLAVLDGVDTVMVAVAEIPDRIYFRTNIGERLPTFATALGKVLLAYQPIETWEHLISQLNITQKFMQSEFSIDLFKKELVQIRQQGFTLQNGELIVGLGSIAAPVFDHRNSIVAAIDISGLSSQIFNEELLKNFTNELIKSANKISGELGYHQ